MSQNPFSGLPQFEPQPAESPAPRKPGRPPKAQTLTETREAAVVKLKPPIQAAAETASELDMLADIAARLNALPAPQRQRIVKALGRMYP